MVKNNKILKEGLFGNIAQTISKTTSRALEKPATSKLNLLSRAADWLDPNKELYGTSERERLAARKFIDNFTQRGLATLTSAVKSKLVDPNSNEYKIAPKSPVATASTIGLNPSQEPAAPAASVQGAPTKVPKQTIAQKGAAYQQQQAQRRKLGRKNQPLNLTREASQYELLNTIFENYISELDKLEYLKEQDETNNLPSISQYFYDNFIQTYLSGIPLKPLEPKINEILKNLPNLYKTGQIKGQLEQLALVAWTLATRSLR